VVYLGKPLARVGAVVKDSTPEEIDGVRALLEQDPAVKRFAFVSRKLALRRVEAKFPELVKALSSNPLPASFEVVPTTPADASLIKAKLASGVPGALSVRSSRPCV
jgi:cell division protein FtsX